MQISVSNKLAGTVKEVRLGAVMAEIIIQVGDNQLVSAITKDAAEDLALKSGRQSHGAGEINFCDGSKVN